MPKLVSPTIRNTVREGKRGLAQGSEGNADEKGGKVRATVEDEHGRETAPLG